MVGSPRPVCGFSSYETARNDARDFEWENRLRYVEDRNVYVRPCVPANILTDRFITENAAVRRVLDGDLHASQWFEQQVQRLVETKTNDLSISVRGRQRIYQHVHMRLWENDCRRLRKWQSQSKIGLASYLAVIISRAVENWASSDAHQNCKSLSSLPERIATAAERCQRKAGGKLDPNNTTLFIDTNVLIVIREQSRAIRHTVAGMLRRDSEILRRRYYRGQSDVEIAGAMGMSTDCISGAINRAEKRMQDKLRLMYPGLFEPDAKFALAYAG